MEGLACVGEGEVNHVWEEGFDEGSRLPANALVRLIEAMRVLRDILNVL